MCMLGRVLPALLKESSASVQVITDSIATDSHVHAGPGLACSVASMSYPSIATDQIIRNYVMIGFQSGS